MHHFLEVHVYIKYHQNSYESIQNSPIIGGRHQKWTKNTDSYTVTKTCTAINQTNVFNI